MMVTTKDYPPELKQVRDHTARQSKSRIVSALLAVLGVSLPAIGCDPHP